MVPRSGFQIVGQTRQCVVSVPMCLITPCLPPMRLFPPDIKKRIENLIEREFLERDPNDRKMYRYLA